MRTAKNAIEYGKQIGESLGALADCLVLGESWEFPSEELLHLLLPYCGRLELKHVLALACLKILEN